LEQALSPVVDAISSLVDVASFALTFERLGVFPSHGAPRVLWVGVGAGASQLADVQRFAAARIESAGITLERRRFDPHLTLARWRNSRPVDERRVLALDRRAVVAHLLVDHVTLYQSRLGPTGPHHTAGRACYPDVMRPFIVLAAYCIGSVPFAWLLVRRWGATDLRNVGSGNLGAANVLRASGVSAGVLVAVLDVAKGAASVLLAQSFERGAGLPARGGVGRIVGHIYPCGYTFRGGKGVATACGAFAILAPVAALPALVIFAPRLSRARGRLTRRLADRSSRRWPCDGRFDVCRRQIDAAAPPRRGVRAHLTGGTARNTHRLRSGATRASSPQRTKPLRQQTSTPMEQMTTLASGRTGARIANAPHALATPLPPAEV